MNKLFKSPQYVLFIGVLIIFSSYPLQADWVSQGLYPSQFDSTLYEVNQIKFTGNENFDSSLLNEILKSQKTDKGIVFEAVNYYYEETRKNPYTPDQVNKALKNSLAPYQEDIKYFSRSYVESDSVSIYNYYNKQGYHLIDIKKAFYPDSTKEENVLEFIIDEGPRFKIGDFILVGLDSLTKKDKQDVRSLSLKNTNVYFSESLVLEKGARIRKYLRNHGYKNANYTLERVVMNKDSLKDSVTITFDPGLKLKIRHTDFIHIKFDNKKVSDKILFELVNWEEDGLYRHNKIEQVQQQLFDLGVFNSVKTEVTNLDSANNTIDLNFLVEYREQRNYKVSAGVNRTDDNFTNIEGAAEISHQNIFGGAQYLQASLNVIYRDINDLNNSRANTGRNYFFKWGENSGLPQPDEYAIRVNYLEHSLTTIGDARLQLEFKPSFSLRRIFNDFNIRRISMPLNFPVKFKTNLDLSQLSFKFLLESEKTLNFESVQDQDDNNADPSVIQRLLEANVTYDQLDAFGENRGAFPLTTAQIGFSATKDERNNNFYPSGGYLIDMQVDANLPGQTLSKFLRTVVDALHFWKLDKRLVLGGKFKAGYIWFYNSDNNYVPLDKQFYSGGANSVRGWAARKLRYTESYDETLLETGQVGFLENYVGNTSLMEFSLELRYDFKAAKKGAGIVSTLIGESSVTTYLDGGNSFNWLIDDEYDESFSFARFAYSFGVGYGYRTPLGPLRIDYALPIFGPPNNPSGISGYSGFANPDFRINDTGWLLGGSFHIALGYAF